MGKGVIHASPKTVFDAVRNPRMKFTYDETLKVGTCMCKITGYIPIATLSENWRQRRHRLAYLQLV